MEKFRLTCLPLYVFVGMLLFFSTDMYAQRVGRWEKLGERTVNLTLDRDVIYCSHKGTFSTIRFHVEKAPVEFLYILVKYANGATDELRFKGLIRAGGNSPYLDLRGNRRVIKEIVIYYKSVKKARHGRLRQARVQVWGR